jgi:hypothetical protein
VAVAGHIFVRNQVQAITRARDEANVRGGIKGGKLVGSNRLVEEVYRDVVNFA